ncbi:protein interacting with PRKCA 1 isoform X3 [Rhodnius prolixus]|uniref:protein interacting with PRKCA 1 isoform X3 n=1 Tax=Rhodnius prolixus TaxID=13249 RepID=UPI003D18C9C7
MNISLKKTSLVRMMPRTVLGYDYKPLDLIARTTTDPNMYFVEDKLGMTVTSGIVNIKKDTSNLIGISIGGGAPLCPCLYIVQVFDNTPAAREGTLQSGDELVGVNGQSVKGKTKVEVAKMIQACNDEVNIKYNKLHADPSQGKTVDIILKKVKHRLVDNVTSSTADALGLSRAILCNDSLVKKLAQLDATEQMYRALVGHTKRVSNAFYRLLLVYKAFGDAFAGIGVREPQPRASEAFRAFGDYHRLMEKNGIQTLKTIKPILSDLSTFLSKAIPDTKLTISKYADAKFEYLSYCLKVKEMDDEEYSYAGLQEPLYRVETGNYEYRLILRCRQEARAKFARLRSDVLVKLELLDSKHVEQTVRQLHRLVVAFSKFHDQAAETLRQNALFPIEMDLQTNAFQYSSINNCLQYEDEEEEEEDDELIQDGVEAKEEITPILPTSTSQKMNLVENLTEDLLIGDLGETSTAPLLTSSDLQQPTAQLQQQSGYLNQLISDLQTLQVTATTGSVDEHREQEKNDPAVGTLIGID